MRSSDRPPHTTPKAWPQGKCWHLCLGRTFYTCIVQVCLKNLQASKGRTQGLTIIQITIKPTLAEIWGSAHILPLWWADNFALWLHFPFLIQYKIIDKRVKNVVIQAWQEIGTPDDGSGEI